jgi:hypothetical protein
MALAVVALPIFVLAAAADRNIVMYGFYLCGLLELLGIVCVLIHIITIKNKPQ